MIAKSVCRPLSIADAVLIAVRWAGDEDAGLYAVARDNLPHYEAAQVAGRLTFSTYDDAEALAISAEGRRFIGIKAATVGPVAAWEHCRLYAAA